MSASNGKFKCPVEPKSSSSGSGLNTRNSRSGSEYLNGQGADRSWKGSKNRHRDEGGHRRPRSTSVRSRSEIDRDNKRKDAHESEMKTETPQKDGAKAGKRKSEEVVSPTGFTPDEKIQTR